MSQEPGWYPDPFHREQDRYWNGRVWTMHTRPLGSADQFPPAAGGAPSQGVDPSLAAPPAHRRAVLVTAVAAGVLVLGGLAGVGLYEGLGGHDSAAASEAITTAASQSLNAKSVDVSLQLGISAPGVAEQISGTGAFDFASQTGTMTVTVPLGGTQDTEQVIVDGHTVYVSLPPGVQSAPGKSWASEDVGQLTSGSNPLGSGFSQLDDPASLLQRLQSMGGTVTALGPTTFDGTAANAYSVEVSASQLEQDLGQAQLPSSLKQLASGLSLPNVTFRVYVGQDGLLRAVDMPFSFSVAGQNLSEHFTMSFSNYGTPVLVTAPPPSEVVPLPQIGSGAGNGGLGNSGTGDSGSL